MININKFSLVGTGLHRECHRHPENKNLCIKVIVKGNAKESQREKKYYRHLEKRGINWDMIPMYYGDIETNLGLGSVFDLILDPDGAVSKTLEFYLSSNDKTETYYDDLSNSLYLLKEYLFQQRIMTMTIKPKNILCQKNDTDIIRLFLVDGIGSSDFIPVCNYSSYLAKKKISRKWNLFEKSILDTYAHNKALYRMLTSSHL